MVIMLPLLQILITQLLSEILMKFFFMKTIIQYRLTSLTPDEWNTDWSLNILPTLKSIVVCNKKVKHNFLLLTSFPCHVASVTWLAALTVPF